jgi:hypothetical protein
MNNIIAKAEVSFSIYKFIKKYVVRFVAFICGYAAATFYVLEPFQLIIGKANQVEGFDKLFNVEGMIAGKLTSLFAIFFFITSAAMYYFWRNQDEIHSINAVLKKIRFILKIPSSFLYICWFFLSGFSLYAYLQSGQVGIGIFSVGTMLFALPAAMFSYWLKDDFFKPIKNNWQRVLYPWVIGTFALATIACFLYSPIDFFFDLFDWHEFINIHWKTLS